jgi:hypothetical protein
MKNIFSVHLELTRPTEVLLFLVVVATDTFHLSLQWGHVTRMQQLIAPIVVMDYLTSVDRCY